MTQTISLKLEDLTQRLPEKPFVHSTLIALSVMAGLAPFDAESADGLVVPGVSKSTPINAALLALQSTLGELGLGMNQRAAGTQRYLALIHSNVTAPELSHLVARDESGNVIGLTARLIAGAAMVSIEGMNPMKPEFDVQALARAAEECSGEIDDL
jgi:hypothetical protein